MYQPRINGKIVKREEFLKTLQSLTDQDEAIIFHIDIISEGKEIGTWDNDVMDHYGNIIKSPESYSNNDRVVIKVPSEKVYGKVSIFGSEKIVEDTSVNLNPTTLIKTDAVATGLNDNLIVVGGSCINTVAANLLGGSYCGSDFTSKVGISSGQALIQVFNNPYAEGKIAILVAGYDAADTTRAVNYLINNEVSNTVGTKIIV